MVFETILQSDLQKMVNVKQLTGNLFSADNGGNKITVEILDGGAPATVSGSVYGYAIREDGKTVVIEGTLSGNKASIVLPASAYAVIGKLNIVIKVGTATVGACSAYVYRTTTDAIVDPGSVVPDISELLAQIGACEEATTAANTAAIAANTAAANVGNLIAPAYANLTFPISKGQPCIYNNVRYQANQDIATSEAWTASHWSVMPNVSDESNALKSALNIAYYDAVFRIELDTLEEVVPFIVKSGDVVTARAKDGTAMTVVQLRFKREDGTEDYWSLTGRLEREITMTETFVSVYLNSGTAQNIVVSKTSYTANKDDVKAVNDRVNDIYKDNIGYAELNSLDVAAPFFAKTGETIAIESNDGTAITASQIIFTKTDGTTDYATIGERNKRYITLEYDVVSVYLHDGTTDNVIVRKGNCELAYQKDVDNDKKAIKALTESAFADGLQTFYAYPNFVAGGLDSSGSLTGTVYRVSCAIPMKFNYTITPTAKTGFEWGYYPVVGGGVGSWSGWQASHTIPANTSFIMIIRRTTDNTKEYADVAEFTNAVRFKTAFNENNNALSTRLSNIENIFRYKKFFCHLGVSKTSNIVIPCQSIFDVNRAKRLGFDVIELNVHKTSDNKYVCLHGSGGNFGAQFYSLGGEDMDSTAINSVSLDWIKANIRYVSNYTKYQVAPFTLEEMALACKKNSLIPLVQYVDSGVTEILDKTMGKWNYVLSIYQADRANKTSGPCVSWTYIDDIDDAIEKCNLSGLPYIMGISTSNEAFSGYTDSDWKAYFQALHERGYYAASAYIYANNSDHFFNLGLDGIGTTEQVNDFEIGNILNLDSGGNFNDYSYGSGTVSNGILTIAENEEIAPNVSVSQSVFLGKGSMHIRFSGTLQFTMGSVAPTITSDGTQDVFVSSYYEDAIPTFKAKAIGASATVYDMTFKSSKV